MIIGMCRLFSCLPSQLLAEDAQLLQLVSVWQLGTPTEPEEDPSE